MASVVKARPKRASPASSPASAPAMTSPPMPSPGMTAMRNAFAFMDALEPPDEHDDDSYDQEHPGREVGGPRSHRNCLPRTNEPGQQAGLPRADDEGEEAREATGDHQ